MRLLAIVNAASAGGRTAKRWPLLEDALAAAGVDFDVAFTEGPGHATRLVAEAIGEGREAIAACGGDGTLSEVVNGLIDETGRPRSPEIKLAILPSGTGGDFRKTLGIDTDPAAAVGLIADGHTKKIDAGMVEYAGQEGSRRFLNIASCGVGYEVDRRVNELKVKPGRLAYALVSGVATLRHKPEAAEIRVDDAVVRGTFNVIAFANGRYFGGGMMIAPVADPADGQLDVVLSSVTRLGSIAGARRLFAGTHLSHPGSIMLRGSEIEIKPLEDSPMGFDVDGEAIGFAPAKVSVLPAALNVFVPQ